MYDSVCNLNKLITIAKKYRPRMHITNVQTVTMNAILYLQRLSSRTSLLCNRALRSCEFRAEHHVGYITLPLHFFKRGHIRIHAGWAFLTFAVCMTESHFIFLMQKEEMEAAKKKHESKDITNANMKTNRSRVARQRRKYLL